MVRPSHIREAKASLSDGLDNAANGRYNSGEPRVAVTPAYKKAIGYKVAIFLSSPAEFRECLPSGLGQVIT